MNCLIAYIYAFWVEKLPYITIAVFTLGTVLRIQRWLSAPKDPHLPKIDIIESIRYIILDVVLFRKTFKRDKLTWALVFAFHGSIGGILFGHMRGFNLWSASLFDPLGHWLADWMIQRRFSTARNTAHQRSCSWSGGSGLRASSFTP